MKPILFSVSYAGLWGQHEHTLEAFAKKAARLGYQGIEIMCKRPHLSPLDWDNGRLQNLAAVCRESGISIDCLGAYTNFTPNGRYPEIPWGEMQIRHVESIAAMSAELGCPLVRVFTSYEDEQIKFVAQWDYLVSCLRECALRAEAHGVVLGIQNHHDLAVHSKAMEELLLDIDHPNCRMMLDPWSPSLRGEAMYETAKRLAPTVCYCTFADYVRLPRFKYKPDLVNYSSHGLEDWVKAVPFGDGEIDNLAWLSGLKAGGFDGPVCYEMCSPLRGGGSESNLDACAAKFLAWMRAQGFVY